jgi:acetate kinase
MRILAVNAGSSSVKLGLFEMTDGSPHEVWSRHGPALRTLLKSPRPDGVASVDAVGHRIVHGGEVFREPVRLDSRVREVLAGLSGIDPEHSRLELEAVDAVTELVGPGTPQVAVFDTAFHATLEPAAYVYPGPYEWRERGIRRYGFHGISYQYVARRAAEVLGRPLESLRLVICHLGSGCSLAAVRHGRSVDTTMGFTPLEGLMMGTRSGSVDPGILIHLSRDGGMAPAELDRILNRESGLKGVSGISGDMRDVLRATEQGNARARLAFDVFVHRLCGGIGAMLASLGGMDALVFTGGIGENTPSVRKAAAEVFAFLGVRLDGPRNEGPIKEDIDLATADSAVRVLVVRTREEEEIAREVARCLGSTKYSI